MVVKMIVTDLDGTLLRSDGTVSDHTAVVLAECQARGIKLAFATARPERATKRFQTKVKPDYVIANNGASVHCGGTVLRSLVVPPEVRDALVATFLATESISCITQETGEGMYTNYDGPPWDEEGWNPVYSDFSSAFQGVTLKLSAECEDAALLAEIVKKYPMLGFYSNTGEAWHQIMHKDASKTSAILFIAEALGFDIGDVIAFGDDYNDIEMLKSCGVGVAVANAIDEVKAVADDICETNDEDGEARWIEREILMHSQNFTR
jgi:Cof subfamily protein (haloacid dehalogenase superfamily)